MNDLFSVEVETGDQRYFLVRDDPRFLEQKQFLQDLWGRFRPFADASFKFDIAAQFHPKFWEIYLGCAVIENGIDLIPRQTHKGPDLLINLDGKRVWIEATAPDEGRGPDAVPKPKITPRVFRVPEEKIILRYTNSIIKKHLKLKEYLSSGLISSSDGYILAINGFDIPFSYSDDEIPFFIKAVLPFGDYEVTIDIDRMKAIGSRYQYRDEIQKNLGSEVSTEFFLNRNSAQISGILFSRADLWNLPRYLGLDFEFLHHPEPDNPIKRGWFSKGKHYWVEGNQLRSSDAEIRRA